MLAWYNFCEVLTPYLMSTCDQEGTFWDFSPNQRKFENLDWADFSRKNCSVTLSLPDHPKLLLTLILKN